MNRKRSRKLPTFQPAPFFIFAPLFLIALSFFFPELVHSGSPISPTRASTENNLLPLVSNGSVLLKNNQKSLVSLYGDIPFIPASILKIATASCAFSVLGPNYRFKTEIYQRKNGDIFIKGYGDPFLVSEELDLLIQELKNEVAQPIGDVFVDQSYFDLTGRADGAGKTDNPYDAGNFALAVNFNTLNIVKTKNGKIHSAEPQTPDLPMMQLFQQSTGRGATRINISRQDSQVQRYAIELFSQKLIGTPPKFLDLAQLQPKTTPLDTKLILTHFSTKTLVEVAEKMLLYSNNFIANQIFLACGAEKYGSPATWKKGQETMELFLTQDIGLIRKDFSVIEGSGISKKNRITAEAMIQLLEYFQPFSHVLPKHKKMRVKSGTLTGVYSYAGYLRHGKEQFPFVIMLNQNNNYRDNIFNVLLKIVSL